MKPVKKIGYRKPNGKLTEQYTMSFPIEYIK